MGRGPIDYNQLRIEFGVYAKVFEDNVITNTPDTRSIRYIALGSFPTENGKFLFMNLNTGSVLWGTKFRELPITYLIIQRVYFLAKRDKQKNIVGGCPLIEWRSGITFIDNDDDTTPLTIPAPDKSLDDPAPFLLLDSDNTDNDIQATDIPPIESIPTLSLANNKSLPFPSTLNFLTDNDESISNHVDDDISPIRDNESINPSISPSQRSDSPPSIPQRSTSTTEPSLSPTSSPFIVADQRSVTIANYDTNHDHIDNTLESDNTATSTSQQSRYNTRNRRISYGFRLANQMSKSNNPHFY